MAMKMNKLFPFLLVLVFSIGCEKLEFEPRDEQTLLIDEALRTPEDVELLLNSSYEVMANTLNGRSQYFGELLSDNLATPLNNQDFIEVYNHNMLFFNGSIGSFYGEYYITIFRANSLLEYVDEIDGFTEEEKSQIIAEAKFLRALCHFEVVRLFAHPFHYTSDNSHDGIAIVTELVRNPVPRTAVQEAYDQIIEDLTEIEEQLPDDNDGGVYATRWAAKALLAKVYFQMHEYQLAKDKCDEVINSGKFTLDSNPDRYRQDVTSEAIYYIESTPGLRKSDGLRNEFESSQDNPQLTISGEAYQLYDTADSRLNWFIAANVGETNEQIKFTKFDEEYFQVPYLNLTQIYLTRAECNAILGNGSDAVSDVNLIIERAYGNSNYNVSGLLQTQLVERIRLERRKELMGEGDRIDQIKRIGSGANSGFPALHNPAISVRGDQWDCDGMIMQFPISERSEVFELNPSGGC